MTDVEPWSGEVGTILMEAQTELKNLREQLVVQRDQLNLPDLVTALAKTEEGIQRKAEDVINHLSTHMQTVPLTKRLLQYDPLLALDTMLDLVGPLDPCPPSCMMRQPGLYVSKRSSQVRGLTPGQRHQLLWALRAISNPQNLHNRAILRDHYGVHFPHFSCERKLSKPNLRPVLGPTVDHLATAPRVNRINPQLALPAVSDADAQRGLLSLIERGFIPPAAQVTLDPSPVCRQVMRLHHPRDKFKKPHLLDMPMLMPTPSDPAVTCGSSLDKQSKKLRSRPRPRSCSARPSTVPIALKTFEMPLKKLGASVRIGSSR